MRVKVNDRAYVDIATELGVPPQEVRRAVESFFDVMVSYARKLPFNSISKIYTHDSFDSYRRVFHIPSVGRIGPVYSRYLAWRSNVARDIDSKSREQYTPGREQDKDYRVVWMMTPDGRRLARQVIKKQY